jgi:hypothetical protein
MASLLAASSSSLISPDILPTAQLLALACRFFPTADYSTSQLLLPCLLLFLLPRFFPYRAVHVFLACFQVFPPPLIFSGAVAGHGPAHVLPVLRGGEGAHRQQRLPVLDHRQPVQAAIEGRQLRRSTSARASVTATTTTITVSGSAVSTSRSGNSSSAHSSTRIHHRLSSSWPPQIHGRYLFR